MSNLSFTEDDLKKLTALLITVSQKAKLELSVNEFIDFYNLLDYSKVSILPKIKANIFEIQSIKQAPTSEKQPSPETLKKGKKV